jgi:hypothetical protein
MFDVDVSALLNLARKCDEASQSVPREMEAAFRRSGPITVSNAQALAPVFTGQLRGGIGFELRGSTTLVIKSTAPYSIFVEEGTRPHFPPVDAVAGWAKAHGIVPFVLARAISRRGTRKQPFLKPGVEKSMPAINAELDKALKIVLAKLGG